MLKHENDDDECFATFAAQLTMRGNRSKRENREESRGEIHDRRTNSVACMDKSLVDVAQYGQLRPHYDQLQPNIAKRGILSPFISKCGPVWPGMGRYGVIWRERYKFYKDSHCFDVFFFSFFGYIPETSSDQMERDSRGTRRTAIFRDVARRSEVAMNSEQR